MPQPDPSAPRRAYSGRGGDAKPHHHHSLHLTRHSVAISGRQLDIQVSHSQGNSRRVHIEAKRQAKGKWGSDYPAQWSRRRTASDFSSHHWGLME